MSYKLLLILIFLSLRLPANNNFLNILTNKENKLFNKRNYKKLLESLNQNIENNDARNFFIGYLLYKKRKIKDAFLFFNLIKDENLSSFAFYYMGRYYFNHNKFNKAKEIFKSVNRKHYFEETFLLYQSKIYLKNKEYDKVKYIYEKLLKFKKKKRKKEIYKLYISFLYKLYTKNKKIKNIKKEIIIEKKREIKEKILDFLDLDSLANNPWLKIYVKKIFKSEYDYFQLLIKRYYYFINKFKYINALNMIDYDIKRYNNYRKRVKSWKRKKILLNYRNRLYLLKIEILYKLRRYKKTFPIFSKILNNNKAYYYYWFFKVLYKRNLLKKFEHYYKKVIKIIYHSEYIEEIDYLRAIINFNNHKNKAERLFYDFFNKYKISNKILEMKEKLAWFYYRKGVYSKAIFLYENISKEDDYKERDLGYYWLGKIYKKIGLNKKGENYWKNILLNSPLTYYSNLVLNYSDNNYNKMVLSNRKKLNKKLNIKNFDEIINDKKIPNYIRFFIKYRFYNLARYELFYFYKSKNRKINYHLKLALAKLFYLNQKSMKYAHAIFHRDMGGADYPENESLEIWQLAFPNRYMDDVRFASKKILISTSLIYSIIREESSFNRLAKSYSNAYGLMQLLYPTAKRLRINLKKYTKLNFNHSWKLFNSRYNISLGTTYLKFLDKEFKGNKISMIASYNAGEKNISRWRKRYKNLEEDEFVESIPINQTKNYVKKVLASYYVYSYIYDFTSNLNYISIDDEQDSIFNRYYDKKKKKKKRRKK